MSSGVIRKYWDYLPVNSDTPLLTLGEGDTPLVKSNHISEQLRCGELYFKLEGCNPTGSFKDRGMVVAMAKAIESDSVAIMCASTGNTSASAASYGAYCGLKTTLIVPKGNVARGKLAQAVVYGARIAMIDGNFDDALAIATQLCQRHPIELVNSVNPNRIDGQKTAAFEIIDDLGFAPDYLFIPVGNAGNITAYWKGFKEFFDIGRSSVLPVLNGYQALGAAPIVNGAPVAEPKTVASAIRIGNPASWKSAIQARDESNGVIGAVSDEEILSAYRLVAEFEGIFCEPASAASLAGLMKQVRSGRDLGEVSIVCVLTGNGLKDTELAIQVAHPSIQEVSANYEDVMSVLTSQMAAK